MLSANVKKTLDNINDKCNEIAHILKPSKHILFCGATELTEVIAKEGALKMKEMTYLHCQSIQIEDISNNFYCFMQKNPDTPLILIVLDHQKNKKEFI